jgi:hypothetical protein
MLRTLGDYVKVAVDIERGVLAGGGAMHADCRTVLLENGSLPNDVWGGDWIPDEQRMRYMSLINVRPNQENRSSEIQIPEVRTAMETIVKGILARS